MEERAKFPFAEGFPFADPIRRGNYQAPGEWEVLLILLDYTKLITFNPKI